MLFNAYYTGVGYCLVCFLRALSEPLFDKLTTPHFLFIKSAILESDGNKFIVAMNTCSTASSILKELGYANLRDYVYRHIPDKEFDSHASINVFPNHFPQYYYERMLAAYHNDVDINKVRFMIANHMGIFLGKYSAALGIEKIGMSQPTLNLNNNLSCNSLWRKTE